MEEVLFYTPFLVVIERKEVTDIPAMLSFWKDEFLFGWNLEVWQKLEKNQKPSGFKKAIGIIRVIVKWLWPTLAISLVAYFGVWSALFLAIVLLPIQLVMTVYLLLKLYSFVCVASAFNLENPPNKSLNRTHRERFT